MTWLAPEGQFEALTTQPITRISNVQLNNQNIHKLLVGQTLFHTPSLLGGQAAKARISCASCHTNGRTNPHFQFPGVSGEPGTADITHSFFSSFRGDGKFNPVAIPDLTQPGKVSRDVSNRALETFIRDLIVEEFDGVEPDRFILDALSYYIRSLAAPDNEDGKIERSNIDVEVHFDRSEEAIFAVQRTVLNSNPRLAHLLIAGSRHQIGLIHQRFQGKSLRKQRNVLETIASDLGKIQKAVTDGNPDLDRLLDDWRADFSKARNIISEEADRSLYNPTNIKLALENSNN